MASSSTPPAVPNPPLPNPTWLGLHGCALRSFLIAATLTPACLAGAEPEPYQARVNRVLATPGCVAFWDFVKREPDGARRFTAHVPRGDTHQYPLDAGNYVLDFWGRGRPATYSDFPLLGRGPFGQAVGFRKETDPDFRPVLLVPRSGIHDSPLDIKGAGRGVSLVVWAIRESGNHALAGIWHEGTDLKEASTAGIRKVERGQRQYALFAGLNKTGSACGHVSENGASSFLNKYALHKSNSGDVSPEVSMDAPAETLDSGWQCFAMTFNPSTAELTGWLNGVPAPRWLDEPARDPLLSYARNAWLQARLHRQPGLQPGEDPQYPSDQLYAPPEDRVLSEKVLEEKDGIRVVLREFAYTRVRSAERQENGRWTETGADLASIRLNPWWYPHGIYSPANDGSGGPFTIGRVIHSSRSVGFTGWIGGVAVFDRALTGPEMEALAGIAHPGLPRRP